MTFLTSLALASLILAVVLLILFSFWGTSRRPRADDWSWQEEMPELLSVPSPKSKRKKTIAGESSFPVTEGRRGDPHTCPVCAAKFEHGESVRSKIFPPTARNDRLLHISGCSHCLNGKRRRECPVCGAELALNEFLTARIFQRPGKSHVHIVGCSHCRKR
ncbi:MAG: hypothetical protein LBD22_01275 [Spirochaetaceae bacterium]|nr:hypothetical protein [Spirochaetaceae bacterium]